MRVFAWLCVVFGLLVGVGGTAAAVKYNREAYSRYLKHLTAAMDYATIRAHLTVMASGGRPRAPGEINEDLPIMIGGAFCAFGILLLAIRRPKRKDDDAEDRIPCPYCAEEIKLEAVVCPHCRRDLAAAEGRAARLLPRNWER